MHIDIEKLARTSAHILGESSAAAMALNELERRRKAGEDVAIFMHKRSWIVGPSEHAAALSRQITEGK